MALSPVLRSDQAEQQAGCEREQGRERGRQVRKRQKNSPVFRRFCERLGASVAAAARRRL